MKKLIMLVLVFVVLVIIATVVVFSSAKDVSVVSADITSVSSISLEGVTLNGYVDVHNGGFLPVGVENITYTVYIEDVEGIIGEGVLDGHVIKPRETGRFPYSIRISWVPTIDTAIDLLLTNSTFANIDGVVNVASIGVVRVALPFSAKVNLKGYIEQFVVGVPVVIPGSIVSDVMDIVGSVVSNVTEGVGTVKDTIEGIIS